MKVEKDKVVQVDYEFRLDGSEADSQPAEAGKMVYLQGYLKILPILEQALEAKQQGDECTLTILPEQGYGEHRPELVFKAHKDYLPDNKDVKPGDVLYSGHGDRQAFSLRVVEVTDEGPIVDGNHPFAGKTLVVKLKVQHIRDATEQEIANQQPIVQ